MSDKIEVDIKCAHCSRQLQSDEQPCSYCGLTGRIIDVCTSEAREMNESVRRKMKNEKYGSQSEKAYTAGVRKGDSYYRDGKKKVERMIMIG